MFNKNDEVRVVAPKYSVNAQYNGQHGKVCSDGVIRDPHSKQISGGNYYAVTLDICTIAICEDHLKLIKRALVAAGAAGAP